MSKPLGQNDEILFTLPKDCGNSPKKKIIQEILVAAARKDSSFILENSDENVCWNIVNKVNLQGKEKVGAYLQSNIVISQLELSAVITHGKQAAAHGQLTLANGDSYSFCHVIDFISAGKNVLKNVTSYVIKLDE
ncbi:hypothetical protein [Cytobacillus gottheilii]|uniref:hypothetical protein n=1 Tax=Cytobacillus gottheilii TaxID=859144 RepID=UPI0009BBDBFC|nr:hypothetical protein [Cytobacillus gottheilii]